MVIVVIGGLITSAFLSQRVIPVVFTFVDDLIVAVRAKLDMRPDQLGGVPVYRQAAWSFSF